MHFTFFFQLFTSFCNQWLWWEQLFLSLVDIENYPLSFLLFSFFPPLPSFLPLYLTSFLPFLFLLSYSFSSFFPSFFPSFLLFILSFLPSFLPYFLPSFLPYFLPSLFPYFLPSWFPSLFPSFLPFIPSLLEPNSQQRYRGFRSYHRRCYSISSTSIRR